MAFTTATDYYFAKNTNGVFDLVVENNQLKTIDSFDTALAMILYCEQRADESEVAFPQFRRGWLGNQILRDDGYEIGSKLWELEQARCTQSQLNIAIDNLTQQTQWLIDDGHCKNVVVSGSILDATLGGILITITYTTINNIIESRYFELWRNTGNITIAPIPIQPEPAFLLDSSGTRLILSNGGVFLLNA